ncbi:MAG: DegT/DnrJ/EryC1/StrS aminotransferase family protein [Legionella sp.]|nr:DegT/DnrJ/EryC1/StrS aminotransferase family protein [Legionella sp.]
MLNTPFSPWPNYSQDEAEIIRNVLLSNRVNYWTGSECQSFEKEFATWVGTRYAIALMNGTVALEVALKAIGIRAGDEVIVTPRTFIASASAIALVGGVPIFADVDPDSQNITAETIRAVITSRTKAIICVHLAGWPCDMDPIMQLANDHGLKVIEDCAQAHGAKYKGRSVGALGHIAAWSFCQDKIMTTGGEGGMVTTNDPAYWAAMWSYKDHGKSWEAVHTSQPNTDFRWLHHHFGTNGRMLECQAALGRFQLKKMEKWHHERVKNATCIWDTAKRLPGVRVPIIPEGVEHAAYKCYVFLKPEQIKPEWDRSRILNTIQNAGVPCYSGSCSEIYLEKAFDDTGWQPPKRLPIAQRLGETSLMFLVHPGLEASEIEKTCNALEAVIMEAAAVNVECNESL